MAMVQLSSEIHIVLDGMCNKTSQGPTLLFVSLLIHLCMGGGVVRIWHAKLKRGLQIS